jgi:hypothetical protein
MGLTLHYELHSNLRTTRQVREVLTQLHSAALDLPFEEVQPLVEYEATPGKEEDFPAGLFHATKLVDRAGSLAIVPLRKLIAFRVFPGAGSESAEFGLARYGQQPGWSWQAFCKTQYASVRSMAAGEFPPLPPGAGAAARPGNQAGANGKGRR